MNHSEPDKSSSTKKIVFTNGGGRLGNQLLNISHLIAFYKEQNKKWDIVAFPFWSYASLFELFKNNPTCSFHQRSYFRYNLLLKIHNLTPSSLRLHFFNIGATFLSMWGYIRPKGKSLIVGNRKAVYKRIKGEYLGELDLTDERLLQQFASHDSIYLSGWPIRSWKLFEKHQDYIRQQLFINKDLLGGAIPYMNHIRSKHDFVIGILMRQDDYRTWNDGKYFFKTEQYIEWMHEIRQHFPDKNLSFLIASDEKQDIEKFKVFNVYFATGKTIGDGHFIENIYELSQCDLIMTPPSTFSIWAAFMGNKPILPLCHKNQKINMEDLLHKHIFDAIIHPNMIVSVK